MPNIDWPETWRAWEPWIRLLVSGLAAGVVVALVNNALQDRREASKARRETDAAESAARRRDEELRRRLIAEVFENIARLRQATEGRIPVSGTVRTAWDAAHGIELPVDVFDALAIAYTNGEELNRALDAREWEREVFPFDGMALPPSMMRSQAANAVLAAGRYTHDAFGRALAKLRPPESTTQKYMDLLLEAPRFGVAILAADTQVEQLKMLVNRLEAERRVESRQA